MSEQQAQGADEAIDLNNELKTRREKLAALREQARIARMALDWDAAIATTERLLANSRRQKQDLMLVLLGGRRQLPGGQGPWTHVDFDAVFERIARRQHEHRDRLPLGAPAREHRHAVFVGQAQVEHTDIEVRRAERRTRLRGGVDVIHGHAEQAQPGDDATGNETVVFNQQDVHGCFRRGR